MRTPTITDLDFYKNPEDALEFFRRIYARTFWHCDETTARFWGRIYSRRHRKPVGKVDVKL